MKYQNKHEKKSITLQKVRKEMNKVKKISQQHKRKDFKIPKNWKNLD
jgi:hypothetical protein